MSSPDLADLNEAVSLVAHACVTAKRKRAARILGRIREIRSPHEAYHAASHAADAACAAASRDRRARNDSWVACYALAEAADAAAKHNDRDYRVALNQARNAAAAAERQTAA